MRKLKPEEDAFGQEMWAYYKGERGSEIVERDDGYFEASPNGPRGYFSEFKDWHPVEQKAMGFVRGRVLDIFRVILEWYHFLWDLEATTKMRSVQ